MSDTPSPRQPVALVTGGSRGIGKACALAFAQAGYAVAFSYVSNAQAAQETQSAIEAYGVPALAVQANASDMGACQALVENVVQTLGGIDVLINNAGITRDNLVMRMKDEEWQSVIDTNLSSAFATSRAAVKPMMKQRSGCIINITSISGVYGNPGQANYSASKAGMIGLTKAMAKEVASRNICINAIAPGFIATDMTEALPTEAIAERIPLGRLGQPEDIASAALFLAQSGKYITGQVLQVDGGLVI